MALLSFSPLYQSNAPHQAREFQLIKEEMYLPEIKELTKKARSKLTEISENPEVPNFQNTVLALESLDEDLSLVLSTFYNQLSAQKTDSLQNLAQEIGPLISDFSNDILLNEKVFQRIKALYDSKNQLKLNQEELQLLEKQYKNFSRNGALLGDKQKKTLREIDSELSKLSPLFSDNVLKATNKFQLVIKDKGDLKGLPDGVMDAAKQTAEDLGQGESWIFTLHGPSFVPFMQYAENRELREKMWRAYSSRAFKDEYDNQDIILKTLELREKRAHLLGFKNHADFVLKERMAEAPDKVMSFLNRIKDASLPAAKKELEEVQAYADQIGGPNPLKPWDFAFYSEKLKENRFSYNSEELRPYFQLEKVVEGAFEHARKLYQLTFKASDKYPIYHPDVKVFEVYDEDSNEFMGLFYTDFFPRDSKRSGAWMCTYQDQGLYDSEVRRPHVAIVCNFTKPTKDLPSLLNFDEVSTLFHEFGHALHALLSQCQHRSVSGTNVYWDFVELPSQLMENWILEKESLDIFARHYKTGEPIPEGLAQKLKDSALYLAGYQSLRQVTFALLDMHLHTTPVKEIKSIEQFEDQITDTVRIFPKEEDTNFLCGFSHIFAGGYAAGYYSYKWAEVLDADAFEYFKESGIFSSEVGKKFKTEVLSRGGTDNPMTLYKNFRGREPDPDALLRRDRLI